MRWPQPTCWQAGETPANPAGGISFCLEKTEALNAEAPRGLPQDKSLVGAEVPRPPQEGLDPRLPVRAGTLGTSQTPPGAPAGGG